MHVLEKISLKEAELIEHILNKKDISEIIQEINIILRDEILEDYEYSFHEKFIYFFKKINASIKNISYEEATISYYEYLSNGLKACELISHSNVDIEGESKFVIYSLTAKKQSDLLYEEKLGILDDIILRKDKNNLELRKKILSHKLFLLVKEDTLNIKKIIEVKTNLSSLI